jgi:TP901 family phage tail tape measure protein
MSADTSAFFKEIDKTTKGLDRLVKPMENVGKNLTKHVTLPLVAVAAGALKASIDFETAFAGVRKTVDATEDQFAALEKGIRGMAKQIPMAATDIARISEAAGQLGIQTDAILGFTRVMADLGVTTNLSGEEAATSLARLANITQMSQSQFSNLGSTIVALGNKLATTEAEIVEMGLRIAGAGHTVGLTEAQILSLAGALSSVGIEAAAGGSAISKVMISMASEVASGGKKLGAFAGVAGMTAKQFAIAWQEDAAAALVAFISGLGQMQQSGENVFPVLDELGLSEVRVRDAMLRAAGAGNLFTDALELGSKAWADNNALTIEAGKRYGTTGSQIGILWNKVKDVAITLGDSLAPSLNKIIDGLGPLLDKVALGVQWFADLDPRVQSIAVGALGLTAALGPLLQGFAGLLKTAGLMETLLKKVAAQFGLAGTAGHVAAAGTAAAGTSAAVATPAVTGLGVAVKFLLGPWGLLIAGVAGFLVLADKLKGAVETSTQKMSRFRREASIAAGTLDGDLSPAFGEVVSETEGLGSAADSVTTSAGFLSRSLGRLGDDAADFAREVTTKVAPATLDFTGRLEGLQSTVSGLNLDLDISKVRFDRLIGGLDPLNDKAAILTATLSFEREQLGLVELRIDGLSDAYKQLVATKGADHEESKKALLDLEQEKLKRDELTRSIAGHSTALKLQNDAQAKTLTMIGEQQNRLLAAGDIMGALTLQEVLQPGYKAPKAKEQDVTAKALNVAEGLHGAFPDKVVDFSKLSDILRDNPNADFSQLQKAVIGLARGGTTVNGGVYDVGEYGRERVFLPAGSTVVPLSNGGAGGNTSQIIIIELDGQEIARKTVEGMPRVLRALGVTV